MNTCPGCGGVIGRDCFNPVECQWISSQMQSQEDYHSGFNEGYRQGFEDAQIKQHQDSLEPTPVFSEDQVREMAGKAWDEAIEWESPTYSRDPVALTAPDRETYLASLNLKK